jgi:hypothetical protein
MLHFLEFLGSAIGGAAICTVSISVVARPLATMIHNLVYSRQKTSSTFTASASR